MELCRLIGIAKLTFFIKVERILQKFLIKKDFETTLISLSYLNN
jgi:hypothetical protein